MHMAPVDVLTESSTEERLEDRIAMLAVNHAISWTAWRRTFLFFIDALQDEDNQVFVYDINYVRKVLHGACQAEAWDFLCSTFPLHKSYELSQLEEECAELEMCLREHPLAPSPRSFGRHRLVLHAFSGRRRIGDVQFYLAQLAEQNEGSVRHVISMDIVNATILGDAMNPIDLPLLV